FEDLDCATTAVPAGSGREDLGATESPDYRLVDPVIEPDHVTGLDRCELGGGDRRRAQGHADLDVDVGHVRPHRLCGGCVAVEVDDRPLLPPCPAETLGCGLEERRSEEHTSELQSRENLVCRLL